MLVRATGYSEQYQRFQLSDIQALVVNPSHRRQNWGIAWGVILFIALIPFVVSFLHYETPIVSSIVLAVAVVFLLINHLLGPTCRVFLVTQVQTVRLPMVRRRRADKVVARLRPLIEAAQADLLAPAPEVPSVAPPPSL